jgi:hypothetical protein
MLSTRLWIVTGVFAVSLMANIPVLVSGQEPGWYPQVIAPPEMRPLIQATPMELRPYRPLHLWGNTVRRMHYRNNPLPLPRDIVSTSTSLFRAVAPPVPAASGRSRPGW